MFVEVQSEGTTRKIINLEHVVKAEYEAHTTDQASVTLHFSTGETLILEGEEGSKIVQALVARVDKVG